MSAFLLLTLPPPAHSPSPAHVVLLVSAQADGGEGVEDVEAVERWLLRRARCSERGRSNLLLLCCSQCCLSKITSGLIIITYHYHFCCFWLLLTTYHYYPMVLLLSTPNGILRSMWLDGLDGCK